MSSSAAKKPAYLRGIPADVVREAKAAAAKRGITLAGFVADTLARAVKGQAASADQSDDLSEEMRWYERNRPRLAREFGGEYIAVVERAVIDHDPDFEKLAERVFAQHAGNVFMPRVSAEPQPLRVRSPQPARARSR